MVVLTGKLAEEKVWLNKSRYAEAEKKYYEKLSKPQKDGIEVVVDNGVQVKNDSSPRKKRRKNANKEEQSGARGAPAGAQVQAPIAKDTPADKKDKKSNKDKKNKVDKDRKDSESTSESPRSPTEKIKEIEPVKEPEENPDDLAWDMVDSQSPSNEQPALTPALSELTSNSDLTPSAVQPNAQVPATDDKRKKDRKRNKKSSWKSADKGNSGGVSGTPLSLNTLAGEVARARQHIKTSLDCIDDIALMASNNMNLDHGNRISQLEKDNRDLKAQVEDLMTVIKKLEGRIVSLEKGGQSAGGSAKKSAPAKQQAPPTDDDDGVDLFGSESEEEDDAVKKIKEQRLAEYAAKKSKKPVLIAKSNIILDVKPWDDETDMKKMEDNVRVIAMDGLIWGASKFVPLAYGIHKLQISCVVEDDKVSVDLLTETIEAIDDYVQSVDIAAFNKV